MSIYIVHRRKNASNATAFSRHTNELPLIKEKETI